MVADGNPEAILIGEPLDGSENPTDTKLGDKLETITGVVSQAFGFYRILPLSNITVVESLTPLGSDPTPLMSDGSCSGITFGGYNVENFYAGDTAHVQAVAEHIVTYLRTPDLVAVQEIQDNNGETDDGTVDSAETLTALAEAIEGLGGGAAYNFTYINPVNDQDGGAPGGNIRVAYLYKADVLRLKNASPGNSTAANEVLPGPELRYNPGLIDPGNKAWTSSRKPLAAAWEILDGGATLFSVNVHWTSKGGSSSTHGDARPPVNGGVENRQAQAELTAVSLGRSRGESAGSPRSAKQVYTGIHRRDSRRRTQRIRRRGGRLQRVRRRQAGDRLRVHHWARGYQCRDRGRRGRAVQLPVRRQLPGARSHIHQPRACEGKHQVHVSI